MISVKKIGHATFETPDIERAIAYYTQYLGLTEIQRDGDTVYLACPSDFHSVVLKKGSTAAVTKLALQLAPGADVEEFAKQTSAKGIKVNLKSDASPDTPRVVTLTDPSGMEVEVFATRPVTEKRSHFAFRLAERRHSSRRISRQPLSSIRMCWGFACPTGSATSSFSCAAIPTITRSIFSAVPSRRCTTLRSS